MGDLGRSQNVIWSDKQLSDNAGLRVHDRGLRNLRVPTQRSHLNSWLFGALLVVACGDGESLKKVSVSVTPKDTEQTDAAVDDAASTEPTSSVCTLPAAQVSSHRECSRDADCEAVTYRPDCCATETVVGVEASFAPQVRECPQATENICKSCTVKPTRAQDGRIAADADVVARCVAGTCRTAVTTRKCGKALRCLPDEVCVATQNVPGSIVDAGNTGDNALFSYSCIYNPCKGALDCSCAQPLCERQMDAIRRCEIEFSDDADVTCGAVPR